MTTTLRAPESPLIETMEDFFRTKTSCDVAGSISFFSPDLATYTDATFGWNIDSFEALQATFEQYMPNWSPPARSYFTALFSNEHGAVVHMVDTPELFGGELRILAAVDFADGKIVRWVDYWDATSFDADLYAKMGPTATACSASPPSSSTQTASSHGSPPSTTAARSGSSAGSHSSTPPSPHAGEPACTDTASSSPGYGRTANAVSQARALVVSDRPVLRSRVRDQIDGSRH